MVARLVRDQEVVGSSPVTSTTRRMAHSPCHPSLFVVTGLAPRQTRAPENRSAARFLGKGGAAAKAEPCGIAARRAGKARADAGSSPVTGKARIRAHLAPFLLSRASVIYVLVNSLALALESTQSATLLLALLSTFCDPRQDRAPENRSAARFLGKGGAAGQIPPRSDKPPHPRGGKSVKIAAI